MDYGSDEITFYAHKTDDRFRFRAGTIDYKITDLVDGLGTSSVNRTGGVRARRGIDPHPHPTEQSQCFERAKFKPLTFALNCPSGFLNKEKQIVILSFAPCK